MNWKTWILIISAILIIVGAAVAIAIGVATHREETFLHVCYDTYGGPDSYDETCPEVDWPIDQCPFLIEVRGETPPSHHKQFTRALDALNRRVGYHMVSECEVGQVPDMHIRFNVPYEKGRFEASGHVNHFKRRDGRLFAEIKIGNTSSDELLYYVIQHEVLTAIGLAHDDYQSSIMYYKLDEIENFMDAPRISDTDKEALQKYRRGR